MTESWKRLEGQVVDGKFPLQQYLGGDESQAVFLTEFGETEPRTKAAIKLIAEDPRGSKAQLQQWRLTEKLSHPNLMRLLASGRCELDDLPMLYVVMEYAEENLSQVIPHRPLTAEEAREMLDPALGALAYVHSEGLVHGHLKPTNILAVDGRLRISSDRLCLSGEHGPDKPDVYAPPEIAVEGYSQPGDVWLVGMTLVEAMTQRRPVAGEAGEPAVPETLPEPFLEIARRCLGRDPQSRMTVDEIRQRLRQSPGGAQVPKVEEQKGTSHRLIYGLSAVLALVLVAIVFGPRFLNRDEGPVEVQPKQKVAEEKAAAATPDTASSGRGSVVATVPPATTGAPGATDPSAAIDPPAASAPPTAAVAAAPDVPAPVAAEPASGEIVQRVMPEVLPKARNSIQGRVRVGVKVEVDASGKVADAQLESRGPSQYFAQLALQAARRWRFAPAKAGDDSRVWTLEFEFLRTGTKAVAVRAH